MIYLFEDRKDRMQHLLSKDIEHYKNLINTNKKIEANDINEFNDFIATLQDANIFMLHKSYTLGKNLSISQIKNSVRKAGKKIIIFSGGTNGGAIVDEQELVLNSGILYENLAFFLEKYKENGKKTDLGLLLFGHHKRFFLHQLKKFKIATLSRIIEYNINSNNDNKRERFIPVLRNLIDNDLDYLEAKIFDEKKEKLKNYINKSIKDKNLPKPSLVFKLIHRMIKAIKDEDLQNIQ